MGIIFKPKRCKLSEFNTETLLNTQIEKGELLVVKTDEDGWGPLNGYEIYIGDGNSTAGQLIYKGHSTQNENAPTLTANWLRMGSIRPTDKTQTGWLANLNNSVNSFRLGERIADLTQSICQRRLVWTSTVQTNLDGTVTVQCNYNSSANEWRYAILTVVEVEISTTTSSGPIIPVIIPDPLNAINLSGTTYRGGYYQNNTNGGGAYCNVSKSGDNIVISLNQAYINGTGKSNLTGQFRVKTLYELYTENYWKNI